MNNSPINSTTVGELADATSLRLYKTHHTFGNLALDDEEK